MNDQSTAELERDAEIARAKVAQTAESIRSRMTPGQLIDEFTGVFSGGDGMAALGNLKSQIRDNPLPLTLIGTGLAWLVLGQGPGGAAPPRGASTSGVTPDPSTTFAEYGSRDDLHARLAERLCRRHSVGGCTHCALCSSRMPQIPFGTIWMPASSGSRALLRVPARAVQTSWLKVGSLPPS